MRTKVRRKELEHLARQMELTPYETALLLDIHQHPEATTDERCQRLNWTAEGLLAIAQMLAAQVQAYEARLMGEDQPADDLRDAWDSQRRTPRSKYGKMVRRAA